MNSTVTQQDKVTIVAIGEERLDANNSGELKSQMIDLLQSGQRNLLIDLEKVTFIDSSGIGALVSGFKNATAGGGKLFLCNLQQQVQSIFELTRLHRVFDIFADRESALQKLG